MKDVSLRVFLKVHILSGSLGGGGLKCNNPYALPPNQTSEQSLKKTHVTVHCNRGCVSGKANIF